MEKWEAHLDEIKSLRDEINWRVRIAYTSSAGFISIFAVIVGVILEQDINDVLKGKDDGLIITGLVLSGLIAMFVGILNSNHLIEKRIELYSLHLQKVIYNQHKEPIYNWLSYLYGFKTKKNSFFVIIEKIFNAGVALFQYALPIILAISILILLNTKLSAYDKYPTLFIFISVLVGISCISSLYLAYFLSIVNKEHTIFYNDYVKKFFDQNEKLEDETK